MHLYKNKHSISSTLLFITLIFASLTNHTGSTVFLSCFMSILLFSFLKSYNSIDKKTILTFIASLSFVLLYAIFFLLNIPSYTPHSDFINAFQLNLFKYVFLAIFVFTFSCSLKKISNEMFFSCLKKLLLLHIAIFYVQFFTIYSSGFYIDFVEPFTGESSRFMFYGATSSATLYRCTGLYVEPSTYAVSIFIIYCIFDLYRNGKYNIIACMTLLSIFLTFSSIAFVLLALLFLFKAIQKPKILILILSFSLIFLLFFSSFFQTQIDKINNTSGIRFNLIHEIIHRPPSLFLFGSGLYAIEDHIMEGSKGYCPENIDCSTTINRQFASPTDSGLLFYLFIKFGFVFLPILFYIMLPFIKNYKMCTSFLCVLITKIQFAFPLVWILILIYRKKKS